MDASQRGRQVDRNFMAGLGKGLAVIECFDERRERLTISEVAKMAGLSRAAARRCLLTLQTLGYVQYDGKFFRLTPRVLRLGYAFLASTELPRLLQPFLDRLSEELQESCSASILGDAEIVYIARSAKKRIMSVDLGVGSRLPAYCTSMGRVLLAALDPADAAARLSAIERRKLTPYTHTRLDDLTAILGQVRRQGYCVLDQELEVGLVAIAVPIYDSAGRTVAAINMGAQSARIPAADLPARVLARLIETQQTLQPLIKT
jgi:IclR family pca regulon transcriptional regulator